MCPLTDDAVGKRVETSAGDPIGVVETVAEDTVYVDVDAGAADAVRATLDWEADTESVVPVDASAVADVTTEAVRIDPERSSDPGTDPVIDRDESTEDEFVDGERRELGPGAGAPDADDLPDGEGRSGRGTGPDTESMQEAGKERHPAEAEGDEPEDGERTVTKDRGREDDR